jgi:hypothetical protein
MIKIYNVRLLFFAAIVLTVISLNIYNIFWN